jgi:hypothetical protein
MSIDDSAGPLDGRKIVQGPEPVKRVASASFVLRAAGDAIDAEGWQICSRSGKLRTSVLPATGKLRRDSL